MAIEELLNQQIPSSVQATDVIPGSEVQKETALRQGTLPPGQGPTLPPAPTMTGPNMLQRILGGLAVSLTSMGEVGKGTKHGLELADQLRKVRQDALSQQATGYMLQLHAHALANPNDAPEALKALGQFLGTNAVTLPLPAQAIGQQLLQSLQGVATKQVMLQGIKGLAGSPDATAKQRDFLQVLQVGLASGADLTAAAKFAQDFASQRPSQETQFHYDSARGTYTVGPKTIDPTKPIQDQVQTFFAKPQGMAGEMSNPVTTGDILRETPNYDRAAAGITYKGSPVTAGRAAFWLTSGEPGFEPIHQAILENGTKLAREQKELDQRQKIDPRILSVALSLRPELKGQLQYVEDFANYPGLYDQAQTQADINTARAADLKTNEAKISAGKIHLYDATTGERVGKVGVSATQLAAQVRDGKLLGVEDPLEQRKLALVNNIRRDFQMANYLLDKVRLETGDNPAANLWNAIAVYGRKHAGTPGAAEAQQLEGIMNTTAYQMAGFYTQYRAALNQAKDLKLNLPSRDSLTIGDSKKMLRWNLFQVEETAKDILGISTTTTFNPAGVWEGTTYGFRGTPGEGSKFTPEVVGTTPSGYEIQKRKR